MFEDFLKKRLCLFLALNITAATVAADGLKDAEVLLDQGEAKSALREIEAHLEQSPDSVSGRFLKARALYATGDSKEAMKIYLGLIEQTPPVPEAYINLSVYYAREGRLEIARDLLLEAIGSTQSCQLAYENLSSLHAGMAGRAYQQALSEEAPATEVEIPPLQVAHLSLESPVLADIKSTSASTMATDLTEAQVAARVEAETSKIISQSEARIAQLEAEKEAQVEALLATRIADLEAAKEAETQEKLSMEIARLEAEKEQEVAARVEAGTVELEAAKEAEIQEKLSMEIARLEAEKEQEVAARIEAGTAQLEAAKDTELRDRIEMELARLESEKEKEVSAKIEERTATLESEVEARVLAQLDADTKALEQEVEAAVESWAESWSALDVEAYLGHYSKDFKPSKGTREAWEKERRSRFKKNRSVKVSIADMQVFAKRKKALANFRQIYKSDTYADEVQKTLILVATNNGWKILHEVAGN